MTGPASVVVIEGMPGMGKTTLLAAYAAKAGPKRAVFWHGFRGVESLTWLSNRLAVFLAQHDERGLLDAVEAGLDLTDRRELMLDALDDARFAFLLDDVHTIDDEDLRRFLGDAVERTKTGKIVVAGRTRPHFAPAAGHVKHLRLEGLDDQGMVAFLEARGVPDAPRLLPRVRDEVGGHPLALTLLVETAHATDVGVEELLDRIPEEDLEEYLLEEVDGTLSDAERRVLGHASVFRTGFTIEDLSALSTRDPEGALYKLRRRLLIQHTEGDFSLHEVVRNFFYNRLRSKTDLHRKAAKHFVGTGTIEGRLEAMHHFLAAGDREHVLKLIERDLDLQEFDVIDAGYHNLYMEVLDAFVKDEVADERRWALIEDERGDIKLHAHDPAGALAHYETSAMFFEGAKDERRIADLAWKRAMACVALKRVDEAKALTKAGLKAAPEGSREAKRLNAFIAEQKWKS